MKRFRVLYGAGPLNLLVLLFCFAIAGVAVMGWFQRPKDVETVIEWFIASVLLHDLLFVPVYTVLDRIALSWVRRLGGRPRTVLGVVNATPYLRIPAILSGLLLLVFFPVIFGFGSQSELDASGIAESGYLARWLIASGVLFAVSGVTWGATLARAAAGRGGAREREPVAVAGPVPTALDDVGVGGEAEVAPRDEAAGGEVDAARGEAVEPARPSEVAPRDVAEAARRDETAPAGDADPPRASD